MSNVIMTSSIKKPKKGITITKKKVLTIFQTLPLDS